MPSRILYVVTEPWYFANHRLDHARALIDAGFEVHVATRTGDRWDEVAAAGCVVHELSLDRGLASASGVVREVRALRRIVRTIRPSIVHAVALKPVAVALALVPMRRRPSLILSVNGLGMTAARGGFRVRVIRSIIRVASRLPRVILLFQTRADQRATVGGLGRGVVIPGVGVDTERFVPGTRQQTPPVQVVYLGRAVVSKGLEDLAAAVDLGVPGDIQIDLYCEADESSPGALDDDALAAIGSRQPITVHAPTSAPEAVLGSARAAILPSRAGEGVSKFVLEAMACGTPVLLSAESGSGEVVSDGETGLLFTAGDARSIRNVLTQLSEWSDEQWAEASHHCRATAESSFSLDVILPRIVDLHRSALPREHR